MTRSWTTLFLTFLVTISSQAQSDYQFKAGLAAPQCHRYGREAIVTDQVAYQLSTATFKKPYQEGKIFTDEGNDIVWKKIEVDSTGRFRGDLLRNGYIYLTYEAARSQFALLNVSGNAMTYVNGESRGGDIYSDGWMNIPVKLKKGLNEILIRCGGFARFQGVSARLSFPSETVLISAEDATLPNIVIGKSQGDLLGAVVIINLSDKTLKNLTLISTVNGKSKETDVDALPPASLRKTRFNFDAGSVSKKGDYPCNIQLKENGKVLHETSLAIQAVNADEHHSYTFQSDIDGSVQYYSVAPNTNKDGKPALFLSVHGAGVQAIGQARAYQPKDWGVLVAPTNRRPRGFNWEDWGRIDALEVLALAKKEFKPDPERIYLTGHSMGGHGTWYLGATYPDKWAAIAPCAGYPTLTGYGSADGKIPDSARSATEQVLLRASNPSNVLALVKNYKGLGVYVFHGDNDRTVPVTFARQMRDTLGSFHPDFSYYEYPGGSHWFGSESVDWPPLFNYFKWHTLKHDTAVNTIYFTTANPAISSRYRWAAIIQQHKALEFSTINLVRDKEARTITGSTENVATLELGMEAYNEGDTVSITLDSQVIPYVVAKERVAYFLQAGNWRKVDKPDTNHKSDLRSGTFKEAFNNRMLLVYGTMGNGKEDQWAYNKARYDAEVWYYRGNGSLEIVSDISFDPAKYPDRGIILYGNSETNSAWNKLLKDCPIQVTRTRITAGSRSFEGNDLSAYFTWPRFNSNVASVAVITGTGLPGLNATDANQYFAAGSGFPDYMIFSVDMLTSGANGIKAAGFFDNQWRLSDEAGAGL